MKAGTEVLDRRWKIAPVLMRGVSERCGVFVVEREWGDGALRLASPYDPEPFLEAVKLFSLTHPLVPALLDSGEVEGSPAVVTAWAPGSSPRPLGQQDEEDNLYSYVAQGNFFAPERVPELLAPLGGLLDTAASELGLFPVELSPDHLIYSHGSMRLVGYSRHGYAPSRNVYPDPEGMQKICRRFLMADLPDRAASLEVWRATQIRMLQRLAVFMVTGRIPSEGIPHESQIEEARLGPLLELRAGSLEQGLVEASGRVLRLGVQASLSEVDALVVYDDTAQRPGPAAETEFLESHVGRSFRAKVARVEGGWLFAQLRNNQWVWVGAHDAKQTDEFIDLRNYYSDRQDVNVLVTRTKLNKKGALALDGSILGAGSTEECPERPRPVAVNAEAIRLGLIEEGYANVVGIAHFSEFREAQALNTLLSSSGWTLLQDEETFRRGYEKIRSANPGARVIQAGKPSLPVEGTEVAKPNSTSGPSIAGRYWADLPYVETVNLPASRRPGPLTELKDDWNIAATSLAIRGFAAAWALAFHYGPGRLEKPDGHNSLVNPNAPDPNRVAQVIISRMVERFESRPDLSLVAVRELASRDSVTHRSLEQILHNFNILAAAPRNRVIQRDMIRLILSPNFNRVRDLVRARLVPAMDALAPYWDEICLLAANPRTVGKAADLGHTLLSLPDPDVRSTIASAVCSGGDAAVLVDLAGLVDSSLLSVIGKDAGDPGAMELARLLHEHGNPETLRAIGPQEWRVLRDYRDPVELLTKYGVEGLGFLGRAPQHGLELGHLDRLAVHLRDTTRVIASALLREEPATWSYMAGEEDIVGKWWQRSARLSDGPNLAILGALERNPQLGRFVKRFGDELLDHAVRHRLTASDLWTADEVSNVVEEPPIDVLRAVIASGALQYKAPKGALRREPTASFLRAFWGLLEPRYLLRLTTTDGNVPALWAIHGLRALAEPVTTLATRVGGGHKVTAELLEAANAFNLSAADLRDWDRSYLCYLIELARDNPSLAVEFSRLASEDRSRLLPLVCRSSPNVLQHVDLQLLARASDPEAVLAMIVATRLSTELAIKLTEEGVSLDEATALGEAAYLVHAINPKTLRLLASLPLDVRQKVALGVVEQSHPGVIETVARWGPSLAPILCGPDGSALVESLRSIEPLPSAATFIAAGGHAVLEGLKTHGRRLLEVADATSAQPCDIGLLAAALDASSGVVRLATRVYRLCTTNGVPAPYWETTAALCRRLNDDVAVLSELYIMRADRTEKSGRDTPPGRGTASPTLTEDANRLDEERREQSLMHKIESTSGDTHLGGDDFDQRIIDWLIEEFKRDEGIDLKEDVQALQRLKEGAEKAKVELSTTQQTEVNLPFITADASGPKHLVIQLSRAKLQQLVGELVEGTLDPMRQSVTSMAESTSQHVARQPTSRAKGLLFWLGIAAIEIVGVVAAVIGFGYLLRYDFGSTVVAFSSSAVFLFTLMSWASGQWGWAVVSGSGILLALTAAAFLFT